MDLHIYGRNPVLEALKSEYTVEDVQIARSSEGRIIRQIRNLAENRKVPVQWVEKDALQKIVGAVVHQGVTARVSGFSIQDEARLLREIEIRNNLAVLILDQVQDTHNLGAILRTAEVAGIDGVVLPEKGSAEVNATVAKTSAGALFHIPVFRCSDLPGLIDALHERDIPTLAAVPGGELSLYEADLAGKAALVIGSEGLGVRKNIARQCKMRVSIPQSGKTASLNASVAAGVLIYEIVRQRLVKKV